MDPRLLVVRWSRVSAKWICAELWPVKFSVFRGFEYIYRKRGRRNELLPFFNLLVFFNLSYYSGQKRIHEARRIKWGLLVFFTFQSTCFLHLIFYSGKSHFRDPETGFFFLTDAGTGSRGRNPEKIPNFKNPEKNYPGSRPGFGIIFQNKKFKHFMNKVHKILQFISK